MLLARKLISPGEERRYTIQYDFLDTGETLSTVTFALASGSATVPLSVIAADGKSVNFFITSILLADTPFNLNVTATTSTGQIKKDHIEFNVVPA